MASPKIHEKGQWVFALLLALPLTSAAAMGRIEAAEPHMGTLVRVVAYADSVQQGHTAVRAAFARIREIDERLSDYKPGNELDRLCNTPKNTPVRVSGDLFAVLEHALFLSEKTEGAFDVSIGAQTKQWRNGLRPSGHGRYRQITIDTAARTVTFREDGIRLDFGAIAKGYAADEMLRALARHGVTRAMVAVSGDIAAGDAPPGKRGWRIGIGGTDRVETLTRRAASTSGDTEQSREIEGERTSHILDARTGGLLRSGTVVTVVAPRGIDADSLSTALRVLGRDAGQRLVEQFPGAHAYFSGR